MRSFFCKAGSYLQNHEGLVLELPLQRPLYAKSRKRSSSTTHQSYKGHICHGNCHYTKARFSKFWRPQQFARNSTRSSAYNLIKLRKQLDRTTDKLSGQRRTTEAGHLIRQPSRLFWNVSHCLSETAAIVFHHLLRTHFSAFLARLFVLRFYVFVAVLVSYW